MSQPALEKLDRASSHQGTLVPVPKSTAPHALSAAVAANSVSDVRALVPQLAAFGVLNIVSVLPNDPSAVKFAAEMCVQVLFVIGRENPSGWLQALRHWPISRRPALVLIDSNGAQIDSARPPALEPPRGSANLPGDTLVIDDRERLLVLRHHEIDWARAEGRWTAIHCGETVHTVRRSLVSLERVLDDTNFVRIHRTLVVRLDRIREIYPSFHGDYDVLLSGGQRLPLSRSYVRQFMARTAMPAHSEAAGARRRKGQMSIGGASSDAGTGSLNR